MKKRWFTFILALVLVCGLMTPARAAEPSFDTATRESVAVVYTCLDTDGGELGFGWGTGFFVGTQGENPTYLVTNHHVIEDFIEYGEGELNKYIIDGNTYTGRTKIRVYYDSSTYEEAYIVEYSSSKDVAILKLANPTSLRKPIPLTVPDDSMVGSTVFAIGYPGLSENLFAGATSSWGITDVTVTRGAVSRILTTEGTGQALVQIDCDIKSGNSGGPLVNANGAAIGINTKSVSSGGDQTNYAVNISEAITLLNRNGITYATGADTPAQNETPAQNDTPEQNDTNAQGGTPAQNDTNAQGGTPAQNDTAAQTDGSKKEEISTNDGLNTGVIIGIAAAAVVIILLLILLLKKKPAPPPPPPANNTSSTSPAAFSSSTTSPYGATPVMQSGGELRLQCQSGAFAGRRFSINGQVRIGRDPSCNDLVYPNNTPGISGRHCVVTLSGGQVTLTDLGSSYGTFLANGRKLTPNQSVTLRVGDKFTLGSEKESFVITGKGGSLT